MQVKHWRHSGSPWTAAAIGALAVLVGAMALPARTDADNNDGTGLVFANPDGVHQTITATGDLDLNNPFFQVLGTNGRACVTCHRPAQGWTITPAEVQQRFEQTRGLDPIFRNNDGTNCEGADISTLQKRRAAFSLLMAKGVIRVALPVPAGGEFEIVDVDDPYKCGALLDQASMYRRVLPSTNVKFLSAVMWDGRESVSGHSIESALASQANDATTGHAQGAELTPEQRQAIVAFELSLFTAQSVQRAAGGLSVSGANGGPDALATEPFCIGINDPLGMLPQMPGACVNASPGLNPSVFNLFTGWGDSPSAQQRAIARGEQLFNSRQFVIARVPGLNGGPGDPVAGPIVGGTCTVCHDTPNVGDHSVPLALNLGLADAAVRTPDLPLYTLRNKATGEVAQTTDPGRAMVTGKWADIGKFKGPILRGLSARAPYFHNGSAATLLEAVEFYDRRFTIGLTDQEKSDLVAFLSAL